MEVLDNTENKNRKRKNKSDPHSWKSSLRKKSKLSGTPFINSKGKYIPGSCTK